MDNIKVETNKNVKITGKQEIQRVEKAIEEAIKKFTDLKSSKLLTRDKAFKMKELNYAIAVGKIYLRKLKNRWT